MDITRFELDITGQYPRFVRDYLSQKEDTKDFIHFPPNTEGLLAKAASREFEAERRKVLVEVLREQHAEHLSEAQSKNLGLLEEEDSYTVCTGHQLCLFGGPVYMLYKISSVIKLCRTLSASGKVKVVPIFWMASEDHDIDEIDNCSLFGRRFHLKSEHKGPSGTLPLVDIDEVLQELEEVLGESQMAKEGISLIRSCYEEGVTMASAFRKLIQSLFAQHGLLILDASDIRLKRVFREHMAKEMGGSLIESSIRPTLEMIAHRGEKVQAFARDVNLFYMTKTERIRLSKESGTVSPVEGDKWSSEEWRTRLKESPDEFSPNVLFRPVYQEYVLPNLAYIGGPGELSYWLQLKGVFEAFDMKMPVLILRDSLMWMDGKTEKKWNELGFELQDMFRQEDALYKEFALRTGSSDLDIKPERESMIHQFDKLIDRSAQIDPGILGFAKAERSRLIKSIENLEKKMIRAEKKKHSDSLNRISTIRSKFLPGGSLRERSENFLHWYLRYGAEFIEMLLEVSDPLDARLKVVKV